MKKLVCIALCVLMVMALVGCQSSGETTKSNYKMITPPIEKLSWGMTQEEVLGTLDLAESDVQFINESGTSWLLNKAQSDLNEVAGLAVTEDEHIVLGFFEHKGERILGFVEVYVHAETGPKVIESLTAAYGEPVAMETARYWVSADPKETGADSDFELLNEFDRGTAFQLSGGEQKLFAILPLVAVPGTVAEPFSSKALSMEAEDDFIVQFNAKTYLLSLNGSN